MHAVICLPDDRLFEIDKNSTLLAGALKADIPFIFECGGSGDCATCRVLVTEGLANCRPRTVQEQERAGALSFPDNVRLGCQTTVTGPVTVRRLVVHQPQDESVSRQAEELSSDQEHHLTVINMIARELNRSVDLKQTLHTVLAQAATLLDLQAGWIFLIDPDTEAAYLAASQNLPDGLLEHPQFMEGSCYCLDSYREGNLKGAANVNVITCSRLHRLAGEGTEGLRFHASIPLYGHDRKLGILNVAGPSWRRLTHDDLQLLYTIGDLLSTAIERARLYDQSRHTGVLEERYRLARELHDTLGQGLAAIVMKLDAVEVRLELNMDRQRTKDEVNDILQLARANLNEARRVVLDLRAAPLEGRSLAEALSVLAETLGKQHALDVEFTSTGDAYPLSVRMQTGVYRMAQEMLNNAIRHAEAALVSVDLTVHPDRLYLSVRDDGVGFNPSDTPADRYGLTGLNERAGMLGGNLQIESRPDHGTTIEVNIPLESGHDAAH